MLTKITWLPVIYSTAFSGHELCVLLTLTFDLLNLNVVHALHVTWATFAYFLGVIELIPAIVAGTGQTAGHTDGVQCIKRGLLERATQ